MFSLNGSEGRVPKWKRFLCFWLVELSDDCSALINYLINWKLFFLRPCLLLGFFFSFSDFFWSARALRKGNVANFNHEKREIRANNAGFFESRVDKSVEISSFRLESLVSESYSMSDDNKQLLTIATRRCNANRLTLLSFNSLPISRSCDCEKTNCVLISASKLQSMNRAIRILKRLAKN